MNLMMLAVNQSNGNGKEVCSDEKARAAVCYRIRR